MPRILDPTKVNIRCSECGTMSAWCTECQKFKCKRCHNTFSLQDGRVKNLGKEDCNCGEKKKVVEQPKQTEIKTEKKNEKKI